MYRINHLYVSTLLFETLTDCRIKLQEGGGGVPKLFFCADEIDNMASGNYQTIHGIFADNDSVNEDEFEGFGPDVMIFILI